MCGHTGKKRHTGLLVTRVEKRIYRVDSLWIGWPFPGLSSIMINYRLFFGFFHKNHNPWLTDENKILFYCGWYWFQSYDCDLWSHIINLSISENSKKSRDPFQTQWNTCHLLLRPTNLGTWEQQQSDLSFHGLMCWLFTIFVAYPRILRIHHWLKASRI